MNTITLPAAEATRAAAALIVHAAKDDTQPTITGAAFNLGTETIATAEDGGTITNDVTYWVATDRYTVGRWRCSAKLEGDEFIVPRPAVEWIKAIKQTSVRIRGWWGAPPEQGGYVIRITEEPDAVLVELVAGDSAPKVERSQRFDRVGGNYPPVARLFPDLNNLPTDEEYPRRINLKQESLKKAIDNLTALADGPSKAKDSTLIFHLQPSPEKKAAPLVYSIGAQFSALLQPNMLLR